MDAEIVQVYESKGLKGKATSNSHGEKDQKTKIVHIQGTISGNKHQVSSIQYPVSDYFVENL